MTFVKKIRVLIAGVPSVGLPTQEWRSRMTFKVKGKVPQASLSNRFEAFVPGTTDWLREKIALRLQESVELLQRNIVADVEDAGEFFFQSPQKFVGKTGFKEEEMLELSKEFSQAARDFDLVLLVGGDHAGGVLLYALEGSVARFDQHSDACATPAACGSEVSRNNYVCAAVRSLKKENEIVGVGVREGEACYPLAAHAKNCSIFDIDLDVLAPQHGVETEYNKGKLSTQDLVGAIRSNRPSAIGIFEVVKGDRKAAEIIGMLAVEAIIAAAKC